MTYITLTFSCCYEFDVTLASPSLRSALHSQWLQVYRRGHFAYPIPTTARRCFCAFDADSQLSASSGVLDAYDARASVTRTSQHSWRPTSRHYCPCCPCPLHCNTDGYIEGCNSSFSTSISARSSEPNACIPEVRNHISIRYANQN